MEVVIKPVETAQSLQQPPIQDQGHQDITAIEDTSSVEVLKMPRDTTYGMEADVPDLVNKKVAIKPAPPHVQGSSNPRSPLPPEAETNRDADCQVQLIQKQLLQPPDKQQGDRHANGHVYVLRQVQFKKLKLCKTLKRNKTKTFTSEVKVVPLTYFEELLIRNRAMCLILFWGGHIYFVVLVENAPFLGLKSIVFRPNYYVITTNRGSIVPLFL